MQGAQLNFVPMHEGALIPSANSKARKALGARTILRERAMGYTIETREWADLFGRAQCWAAFTHQGELLTSTNAPQGLCTSLKEAMSLASVHAEASLPRVSSLGRWSEHRQTGGQHYREWLITLPYFHRTFYSTHFEHRNVLIHVRCDIREGDNGQNVLVLHEIQSDWAQHARKQTDQQSNSQTGIAQPPWSAEWPALALKLMLLHAIQQGVAAMAWTRAEVQVKRWNKLGAAGLRELYDRTLPRECNRLLQPFDRRCEEIDVFQPTNYCIDPSEDGYLVYDGNGKHIADCATWQEALCAIPCGSIDELQPMHGVRIDEALRLAITEKGLSAWGNGVR